MRSASTPRRIRLRRTKGWRKPPEAVVVARPSRWGNPYVIGAVHEGRALTREETVELFREALLAGRLEVDVAAVRASLRAATWPAGARSTCPATPTC